jgi:hypothetical protein
LPISQRVIESFAKKLFGKNEVEAALHNLDQLTQEESRMAVAQTLGVTHGLRDDMKVVMEGMQHSHDLLLKVSEYLL